MSNLPRPDPETAPDATAPHPTEEGEDLDDRPGTAAIEAEERYHEHPEADHHHAALGHDAPDHAEHPAASDRWVLVPLAIGAVVGLVLILAFGLGTA